MTRGVLIVETRPASAEDLAAYHDWYDHTHVPEIVKIDGFVSARRLASLDGASFLAIYEIEGDVEGAKARLGAEQKAGRMSPPVGVCLDPPPVVRYFRQISSTGD
jgi:hypothetical protein